MTDQKTIDAARRLQPIHNKFDSSEYERIRPVSQEFARVVVGMDGAIDDSDASLYPEYFYG